MKERPILFSAPMVRALLAGTKTQTRRVVKPLGADHVFAFIGRDDNPTGEFGWCPSPRYVAKHIKCSYGHAGDRLWVRENGWERPALSRRDLREGADTWPHYEYDVEPLMCWEEGELKKYGWKRRPSIHMPRWASRILLEVTEVRVQRLQDISADDAIAEGLVPLSEGADRTWSADGGASTEYESPRDTYAALWDIINGAGSWEANPWVWAVSFKRITP